MKIKINTYGELFSMFVKTPIRTPAIIELDERQYKILQTIAKANGWSTEVVREKVQEKNKKPKTKSSENSTETKKEE